MDFDAVTLALLGVFGLLGLLVMLLIGFLKLIPELAEMCRTAWRSIKGSGGSPSS
ncbi:hypothetical protein [Kitasatospora sp. NPDC057198]|uniref:hypothetical protein n=1 Tax=Kitasatospora sp. NPDC057198 TaxID=3346046 RepID=UPI003635B3F2